MSAGYFTRTYEIWRSAITRDAVGGVVRVWAKVADIPGRCYVTSMAGALASARETGVLKWTFACAADAAVTLADQVRFGDHVLVVQAVSVTSRGDRLQCLCEEVQA